MKSCLQIAGIFLCIIFFGCTGFKSFEIRDELDGKFDELCQCTGLKRSGAITSVERWTGSTHGYNVKVPLEIDGSLRSIVVRLNSKFQILAFEPESLDLSMMSSGIGEDSVKNDKIRSMCVAAVNKSNKHLHLTWYGQPAIQRVGENFMVTYLTVSPAEQKEKLYFDPCVSFLMSPKGTVYAIFFGS